MKTLIIYASHHGCTEKCANQIHSAFTESTLLPIKRIKTISVDDFDIVMIGGSIHAGSLQRSVKKFCENNLNALLSKKVGLFLCSMEQGEKGWQQFDKGFPEALRNHATAKGLFGGAFDFERMNFLEKAVVKKVAGVTESVSNISGKAIQDFIAAMK